jgi:protein-S-isoprenylcysteine O-methyltransferase Ste14
LHAGATAEKEDSQKIIQVIPAVIAICGIVWRLLEEELYLCQHSSGYSDYRRVMPHRLLPFIW